MKKALLIVHPFLQPAARLVLFYALGILAVGTAFAAPPDLTAPGVIAGTNPPPPNKKRSLSAP